MSKTDLNKVYSFDKKSFDELEDDIIEEVAAAIGDLCDGEVGSSVIKDVQPPESVIQAMARAAAAVLIAFEHGYRLGG
jgi:hypothetical protein